MSTLILAFFEIVGQMCLMGGRDGSSQRDGGGWKFRPREVDVVEKFNLLNRKPAMLS
jgi:hypothetical protein